MQQINEITVISKDIKKKLIERDGLRCAFTGQEFEDPAMLVVHHLLPKADGGETNLDNLVLVSKDVNMMFGRDTGRTNLLLEQLKIRDNDLSKREKEIYEREREYRKEIEEKSNELNYLRTHLNKVHTEQETRLSEEVEQHRGKLRSEEKRLREKYTELEKQLETDSKEKIEELKAQEEKLALSFEELAQKEQKYAEDTRKQLERKSSEYVNEALSHLKDKEDKFHFWSRVWSVVGGVSIVVGIFILVWFGSEGLALLGDNTDVSWSYLLLVTFKGVVLVGLFIALAKYSFLYSQSYMHESIKNSERRHAINFGKFYMESFGANADWHEIKDAFEHWNIQCESAFSKQDSSQFDPKALENTAAIISAISKMKEPVKQQAKPSE